MADEKTSSSPPIGLLVTAAGSSRRMGRGEKKEYLLLGEKPVLLYTLLSFLQAYSFEEIIITIPEGDQQRVRKLLDAAPPAHSESIRGVRCITGGESRRESVFLGLSSFTRPIEYVLIHDGARPWISRELIHAVIQDCLTYNASIPVVPISDAIKKISPNGSIEEHMARDSTMGAQTPQAFSFLQILDAHKSAHGDGRSYIDDSEIYDQYVGPVHTVEGDTENKKITFPRDLPPGDFPTAGGRR